MRGRKSKYYRKKTENKNELVSRPVSSSGPSPNWHQSRRTSKRTGLALSLCKRKLTIVWRLMWWWHKSVVFFRLDKSRLFFSRHMEPCLASMMMSGENITQLGE